MEIDKLFQFLVRNQLTVHYYAKDEFVCGHWITDRKAGRVFDIWGRGPTERAAVTNAFVNKEKQGTRID